MYHQFLSETGVYPAIVVSTGKVMMNQQIWGRHYFQTSPHAQIVGKALNLYQGMQAQQVFGHAHVPQINRLTHTHSCRQSKKLSWLCQLTLWQKKKTLILYVHNYLQL